MWVSYSATQLPDRLICGRVSRSTPGIELSGRLIQVGWAPGSDPLPLIPSFGLTTRRAFGTALRSVDAETIPVMPNAWGKCPRHAPLREGARGGTPESA
jgi:hypothetical protein